MDLSTVRNRNRLKLRREPYWQKLGNGKAIGYRPSRASNGGSWIARLYDPETGKRVFKSLRDYGHLPACERFDIAKRDAEAWFQHLNAGGVHEVVTVADACRRYAAERPEAGERFARYLYDDPLARIALPKLTDRHVRAWRERLAARPARVSRHKGDEQVTRPRSPATLNRDLTALRAALNAALDRREVLNDHAWRVALRPVKGASQRRNLYLDRAQRRMLLDALPSDAAAFARGLCLLPLRPGALANLRTGDFDARRMELTVSRDKAGGGRRILLPEATAALLREQARSKLPAAPLFARANGEAWCKDAWKKPIKEAARKAGLPAATTAYTLRHSTITDLVQSGLDLLTIAQVSGTSVAMIEQHYGHLQRQRAAEALAELAL